MQVNGNARWSEGHGRVVRMHPRLITGLRRWWSGRIGSGVRRLVVHAAAVLLSLLLFGYSGPLLRAVDATAGVLDIGILSVLPLALLVVALARLSAAGIYQWMVGPLNELTAWQRTLGYGCLYLSYFWAVVWVVAALV